MKTNEAVRSIVDALKALYPDGICSLNYEKDYELLFSVRLAAQCTDERVNKVTPALYARFPTLEDLAGADVAEVEQYIHSTGFFRAKARDIVLASQMLLRDYGGKVPGTMEELLKLPGVGRKTANLMLGDVFHVPGVVVADTHCIRITGLLGLTDGSKDPVKVEMQLRRVLPPEESNDFCHRLVLHGRAVCIARRPQCEGCTLRPWCDHFAKVTRAASVKLGTRMMLTSSHRQIGSQGQQERSRRQGKGHPLQGLVQPRPLPPQLVPHGCASFLTKSRPGSSAGSPAQ